jgi:hypothetical protein
MSAATQKNAADLLRIEDGLNEAVHLCDALALAQETAISDNDVYEAGALGALLYVITGKLRQLSRDVEGIRQGGAK